MSDILWLSEDKQNPGLTCEAKYEHNRFRVTARYRGVILSQSVSCLHEPIWGIDIEDMKNIQECASMLADNMISLFSEGGKK